MRVRYTPRAFADREQIFDYLYQRSPSGAINVLASIKEAVAQVGEQPRSGYATADSSIRVKFLVRYPYKIFYRIGDDSVELLHIRHTARRPWGGGG